MYLVSVFVWLPGRPSFTTWDHRQRSCSHLEEQLSSLEVTISNIRILLHINIPIFLIFLKEQLSPPEVPISLSNILIFSHFNITLGRAILYLWGNNITHSPIFSYHQYQTWKSNSLPSRYQYISLSPKFSYSHISIFSTLEVTISLTNILIIPWLDNP